MNISKEGEEGTQGWGGLHGRSLRLTKGTKGKMESALKRGSREDVAHGFGFVGEVVILQKKEIIKNSKSLQRHTHTRTHTHTISGT